MEKARKRAIQKELDIYISKRKGGRRKLFKRSFSDKNVLESIMNFLGKFKREKEEEFIENIEVLGAEKPEEKIEDEIAITEEGGENISEFEEKPRRNVIADFFRMFIPSRKVKEEEIIDVSEELVSEQVESEAKEDMKLLAKTILAMLEHISPDEVKRLKHSKEFITFKELLKKYNVIK